MLDSIGEAFGIDGVNEDKDSDVGPWMRKIARPIADAGPGLLIIDHSTKSKENSLHASGSKRKRAMTSGASYLVKAVEPLTRAGGGRLRLVCAKDRHGHHGPGAAAAELDLRPNEDGLIDVTLALPGDAHSGPADHAAIEAAVLAVRNADHPLSQTKLIAAMREGGLSISTGGARAAIQLAVDAGYIKVIKGRGNGLLHEWVRNFDHGAGGADVSGTNP